MVSFLRVSRGEYARTEDGDDDEEDSLDHFGGLRFRRDVVVLLVVVGCRDKVVAWVDARRGYEIRKLKNNGCREY